MNCYQVINHCVKKCTPSLFGSTETVVPSLVRTASVREVVVELRGSVDPIVSAIVVVDSANRE